MHIHEHTHTHINHKNIYKTRTYCTCILLTKTTAAQTEDAHSYYRVRGLYFLAVVFVATIYYTDTIETNT